MFGGLFTGLAEAGLFIIYYNRREKEKGYRETMRRKKSERLKKRYLGIKGGEKDIFEEEETVPVDKAGSGSETEGRLRRRAVGTNVEDQEHS
jgi:hypothetical protein